MMKSEKYANLSPTRLILQCAVPEIITSVFGAFYAIADGIFVGRYLGETALAAVNLLMPIILIVEALSRSAAKSNLRKCWIYLTAFKCSAGFLVYHSIPTGSEVSSTGKLHQYCFRFSHNACF